MVKLQEVDSHTHVFLVDFSSLCPSSRFERRSAINSHAARRMLLKRWQLRREQMKKSGVSLLTWQGLVPRWRVNGGKSRVTGAGSFPLDMKYKTDDSSSRHQPSGNAKGCLAGLELAQKCSPNSFSGRCHRERCRCYGSPEAQSIDDRVCVPESSSGNDDSYSKSQELSLSHQSAEAVRDPQVKAEPMPIFDPEDHDPSDMPSYPFNSTNGEPEVFEFFRNRDSNMICGHGPATPLWYLELVAHQFAHDEAVMHLVLALSSYAWSSLLGGDEHYEETGLMHMTQAIAFIVEKLRQPQSSTSDSTIQAVMLMAAIEVRSPTDFQLYIPVGLF
ncbi:uncharacterized protein Z520_04599 [Fonsecaea multimorphosa CBS 102226]|uniref:Transcription factor domain-containing protein n=1 Tax=Fonsecaea multimorphosa CBS 102226 TaxID=1442371 RepID=A0A0D2ISM9_9EURO|nr:uncharacterized protein Z520_04599 [Fonsecaea multimorphosa CBS 102226]KIX99961.1 hypothetical protein Z520_04599 [Fonsecaea multimorphosa CBS 102226]